MKKVIITLSTIAISIAANAQDNSEPLIDRSLVFDVVHICSVLLIIYVITTFVLQMVKQNFDYRIKSKIIEKETPEDIASKLLQGDRKDIRQTLLQWIFVMAGIGVGFTIINLSRPFGLHSLAIMAFSISGGFIGYYLFVKRIIK
jgi:hypothetical protein